MPFPFQLQQDEYETLVAFANAGTLNPDGTLNQTKALSLASWLKLLEEKNGIIRSAVWVQWQEQDAPMPRGTNFPDKWPPELRAYISLVSRAVARADVDELLSVRARNPTSILVTKDPAALVGWSELDEFFK